MRGQILSVDGASRTGLLLGNDGNRYSFGAGDWRGQKPPLAGSDVDFVADGAGAREVYGVGARREHHGSEIDNSVTLGWLGIVCLALSFVIPVLPTIGALILGLVGAADAKRSGDGTGLALSRVAWIGAVLMALVVVAFIALGLSLAWMVLGGFIDEFRRNGGFETFYTLAMLR